MRVVAIIQARMGSSRLPGKVLADVGGQPVLARVVERTLRARRLAQVVVATTTQPMDEPIVRLCRARGWACVCGSEDDVLDRYYHTARAYGAEAIVRITADCPLIDPDVVDQVVGVFLARQPQVHYVSNVFPQRTFPRGLDTEVIRADALERAWQEDRNPKSREHVSLYLHHHPECFQIANVTQEADLSFMRWVVDTEEDLRFIRSLSERVGHRDDVSWQRILNVLEQEPELLALNRDVRQKTFEEA